MPTNEPQEQMARHEADLRATLLWLRSVHDEGESHYATVPWVFAGGHYTEDALRRQGFVVRRVRQRRGAGHVLALCIKVQPWPDPAHLFHRIE